MQKDKLDFGPFSMAQIRAQIERGEIAGEHLIVDSDSGERSKVKEFPAAARVHQAVRAPARAAAARARRAGARERREEEVDW